MTRTDDTDADADPDTDTVELTFVFELPVTHADFQARFAELAERFADDAADTEGNQEGPDR